MNHQETCEMLMYGTWKPCGKPATYKTRLSQDETWCDEHAKLLKDNGHKVVKLSRSLDFMNQHKNAVEETHELAVYLAGYAAGKGDEKLAEAAEWLRRLSMHVCGQGYIGCKGGSDCPSDHK